MIFNNCNILSTTDFHVMKGDVDKMLGCPLRFHY